MISESTGARSPSSATIFKDPNVSWRSATAPLVGRRARRRCPHVAGRHAADRHAAQFGAFRAGRKRGGPLPARHAAQRPRLRPQRRFPDLEFRHRLPRSDGPRRHLADAGGHHRRGADRESEFRAARFTGPDLDHRVDAGEELDACAASRSRRRIYRPLRKRPVPDRRRRVSLHQRDPVRRERRVSVCGRDHRRLHHAAAHRRSRRP